MIIYHVHLFKIIHSYEFLVHPIFFLSLSNEEEERCCAVSTKKSVFHDEFRDVKALKLLTLSVTIRPTSLCKTMLPRDRCENITNLRSRNDCQSFEGDRSSSKFFFPRHTMCLLEMFSKWYEFH